MPPEPSLGDILPLVRQSLKGRSNFSFENFVEGLWQEFEKVGTPGVVKKNPLQGYSSSNYDLNAAPYLNRPVTEAFYYLFHSGFIAPQLSNFPNHAHVNLYFVTSRGEKWVEGAELLPEDVEGYMKLLRQLAPTIDSVILQYVREGLSSFERRMFFAGAVMVGAAAEKAAYLLADDLLQSLKDGSGKQKLLKAIERRKLFDLLDLLREYSQDKGIPYSVGEGAEPHLMSLFEAIRVQRNDAVHPMNAAVSADSVRLSFQAFPHAIQKIELIRKWLQEHPNTL
jgi:hypothetical protein